LRSLRQLHPHHRLLERQDRRPQRLRGFLHRAFGAERFLQALDGARVQL